MRGRIDEEEGMEDIACGSRVMSKIAKKKPSSSKMMSMGGVKKAQVTIEDLLDGSSFILRISPLQNG